MTSRADLEKAFRVFDADGSGAISPNELTRILTRPGGGRPLSPSRARALVQKFDTNGDGMLHIDEFVAAWSSMGVQVSEVCPIDKVGISVHLLEQILADPRLEGAETLLTSDVFTRVVQSDTRASALSYCDWQKQQSSTEIGEATHFVSHAWRYTFADLVSAISSIYHEMPAETRGSTRFWIDIFSVNQHESSQHSHSWWSETFYDCIREVGHTVLVIAPVDRPICVERVWCLWEIYATVAAAVPMTIAIPTHELAAFREALSTRPDALLATVRGVDAANAQATVERDREAIFAAVRAGVGFDRVNEVVKNQLLSFMLCAACRQK